MEGVGVAIVLVRDVSGFVWATGLCLCDQCGVSGISV